jgi:hypothetical protein
MPQQANPGNIAGILMWIIPVMLHEWMWLEKPAATLIATAVTRAITSLLELIRVGGSNRNRVEANPQVSSIQAVRRLVGRPQVSHQDWRS